MEKRWVFKEQPTEERVKILSEAINVSGILSSLLLQRDIADFEEAKYFFRPKLDMLHDPFLMKDMDVAVERIKHAIQENQKILVYGDYDVDGTTSVALVYDFLRNIYEHVSFYIPDRYTEGYGISLKGIDFAEDNDFDLIISLDCGIKAIDKVAYANDKNIDFIICDHHRPGDELPAAHAVLDPKRNDCSYPFDELSGCGVGFKLMQALCIKNEIPIENLYEYLDLVAVSIAADIVPIVGENRVLAHYGLKKLNANPSVGLQALMNISGKRNNYDITSVVFTIGPRINAAGRISHAGASVDVLVNKDKADAAEQASKINEYNIERRGLDTMISEEAFSMIAGGDDAKKSTVLFKKDWHKGVIGIVASRCIEKSYKPTIILTESNKMATGSARSVRGFDVYEAIAECSDLLEQFGGHKYAAGLTLPLENVALFQEKFEAVVSRTITEEQLVPQIDIDQKINLDIITQKFFNVLNQMAPFGPRNMSPIFATDNIVATQLKKLRGDHVKFTAKQEGTEQTFVAIGFGFGKYYDLLSSGMTFGVAYTIEENDYLGNKSLQLYLKDIKFD